MTQVEVRGVRKSFATRQVLAGVDLSVAPGEVLGLLGPNGAGKSTLISIVTGLLRPDAGQVLVDGIDVARDRRAAAANIGSAPQDVGVYPGLTVRENLRGFARMAGVARRSVQTRCDEVIEALGLTASASVQAEHLSGGQRRRLHLGMALSHRPGLLLLDEPTVGADVESRQQILSLVRALAADGSAVIYTTHYLTELEQLPATIALLSHGTVRVHGSVGQVVASSGHGELRVRIDPAVHPAAPVGWRRDGDWIVSQTPADRTAERFAHLIDLLGADASAITDVQTTRPTLEAAYLRLLAAHDDARPAHREVLDAAL